MEERQNEQASTLMQLMYEQNSDTDDVRRLQDERSQVLNAEVSAVQDFDPDRDPGRPRTIDTLQRGSQR